MLIEFGADLVPVVFLTTDTTDAVVVEGQEGLEEEAEMENSTVDNSEEEAATDGEEAVTDESSVETEEVSGEATDTENVEEGGEATDTETAEGDTAIDEETAVEGEVAVDGAVEGEVGEVYTDEMTGGSMVMNGETMQEVKDPLLSNTFFVGGVSLGVLVVGSLLGFILAKKKIKKGIEIYEDF